MRLTVSELDAHHDRAAFDCGDAALNDFLKKLARQQASRGLSRCYAATAGDETRIRGYYALSAGSIEFRNWPAGLSLPRYPIPVARVGRLAVDTRDQGQGVGAALLRHALQTSAVLAEKIGLHAVIVDAKHSQAATFYARYGFRPLQEGGLTMYLLMSLIRKSFGEMSRN
ncbi:MAG: hypothetical protein QG672_2291 [Pseudomonadota bacterium]|nr:hypothetical protein [Pseudomonadota bacterium]